MIHNNAPIGPIQYCMTIKKCLMSSLLKINQQKKSTNRIESLLKTQIKNINRLLSAVQNDGSKLSAVRESAALGHWDSAESRFFL